MKIFIIEDEPAIREELVQLLQKYGYQCDSSDDFHHIVQAALSSGANLILLDINLPYQDGFQVCREIRQKSNLPIIVLTSRNSNFDELMSLNIGADDYIAKLYNAQILLARIQKLLARTYEVQDNIVLTHKGLTLNLLKAEISYFNLLDTLTAYENISLALSIAGAKPSEIEQRIPQIAQALNIQDVCSLTAKCCKNIRHGADEGI